MWKIAVAFIVLSLAALFLLMKGGDKVDMGGEASHGSGASSAPAAASSAPAPANEPATSSTPTSAAPK